MPRRHLIRTSAVAVVGVAGVLVAQQAASATPAPSGPAVARSAARAAGTPKLGPGGRVIVLLKNHSTHYNAKTSAQRARAEAGRSAVSGVAAQIRHAGGSVSHSYGLINAVAAKVTVAEATKLAANSNVQEVVPDEPIRERPTTVAAPTGTDATTEPGTTPPAGTCAPNGQVKLEPEALEATRADSDVPGAQTARSLGYTGKGVTVGWIADGLDVHNPDFLRNGKSIFTDYQDFSGDGPKSPTGGDEAFLDASAIAAQGNTTYDISHFSHLPLSTPCKIRVEGEAPGVNLVGLNIFGNEDAGYNSSFVQAIQYAATVDHVNVLNESLGSNFYPDDSGSLDAVKAANDAAVAQGVSVTVSSGDAGVTSTIGTPATDPNVIAVGGSTTYRFYLQTGYGGARLPGIRGWVSNNISSLSSGGFEQSGRTVDLVAPGDLNWAVCSKDLTQYSECADFAGDAIGLEESGGTSESAPVTAGVAALVIEAYRAGHDGASPSPAVVKTILTSSADDIQAPADQQGAGLVDAYKAVQLARSYRSSTRTGSTITSATSQFNATGQPRASATFHETITNSGTSTQTVKASARTLGAYKRVKAATVTLSDADSSKYVDFQGITDNYEKVTFTVPKGVSRLDASIAFQNASATDLAARVRMDLVDPSGRLASYSLPQGNGNYGNGQVADPQAGSWTAYIQSRDSADGGTEGPVVFAASVASFVPFGKITPAAVTVAPGKTATVTLKTATPPQPGDFAGSLVLQASHADAGVPATTTVPVTLRALIPGGTQSFAATFTGGNGRGVTTGQTFYYGLDVRPGRPELSADITLAHPDNQFFAYLISPSGNAVASAANDVLTTVGGGTTPAGKPTIGAQLHVLTPVAGRWTLIVLFAPQVSGTATSDRFRVSTDQKAVPASASGLPTSTRTRIAAGHTKTVYVKVTNSGRSPEAFYVDPRLSSTSTYDLASLGDPTTTEPLQAGDNIPAYLVPTRTTSVSAAATTDGAAKIQLELSSPSGDPDLVSGQGTTVSTRYAASPVSQGQWSLAPTEVGPYSAPGTQETVDTAAVVQTRTFDTSAVPSTGDLWLTSVDPDATLDTVTVLPGRTAVIPVRITATGKPRTVHGTLYVDDADLFSLFGVLAPNGNEVAALPYTYTVVRGS